MENPDVNNESDESEVETRIELEDEINQDKLICQTKKANSQRQQNLVPMVTLCMLSYAKSQRSNVYQMVKGHFTFAYNVAKRCVDVLHSMDLCMPYETIRVTLKKCQRSRAEDTRHSMV